MSDHQTDLQAKAPLFSIVIPLEYHRGQWQRCWQGWQSQTLDQAAFEIILVVPPDFPERDRLSELTGPVPRLEYSQHTHDINLCAVGAANARGEFLFFTEAHCWPEPDVLELSLEAFRSHADWAAFSCASVRVSHNRLSDAEADMYEADIEYGMTIHPWRKILDQCFVTRREAYEQCGGLKPEFGHFAEWLLAASYFECGHKIGYLPQARLHHYYIGSLAELKIFTRDFVEGEIGYFSRGSSVSVSSLIEAPSEFVCRDNFDRGMARRILRMAAHDMIMSLRVPGRRQQAMSAIGRWIGPAMAGDGLARAASAAIVCHAYLAALLAKMVGSNQWLKIRFRLYITALIRYQRLSCIRTRWIHEVAAAKSDGGPGSATAAVLNQTGFYAFEEYQGVRFRWSENVAAIRLRTRAGRQFVRIKCLSVRDPADTDPRFFFDGRRLPDHAVSRVVDDFEIRIDVPTSGASVLGWICFPFKGAADPRRLGLPIVRFEIIRHADRAMAAGVDSRSHRV